MLGLKFHNFMLHMYGFEFSPVRIKRSADRTSSTAAVLTATLGSIEKKAQRSESQTLFPRLCNFCAHLLGFQKYQHLGTKARLI
jgi:hypothetical protein